MSELGTVSEEDVETTLRALAHGLTQRGWMLATAESCTGGMIAAACTDLAGSSRWFDRGFVTYSNAAKTEMLGVPAELIEKHGAVSEPVARAMAQGAALRAGVEVALAVTGIAGPEGGSTEKPVGTVWMGWHVSGETVTECLRFSGGRAQVRQQTVQLALERLIERLRATDFAQ